MNAILLEKILAGIIATLIVLCGVAFYFASQQLSLVAKETNRAQIDAEISSDNISQLKRLEAELNKKSDVVERTAQIVSDSTYFQHQDQIIKDVTAYAGMANVQITAISFDPVGGNPTSGTPRVAIKGASTLNANVTLRTPMRYDNFLLFLKAIEQNLTKMQVTGVNMIPDKDNPEFISNPSVGLMIYVKAKS